MASATITVHKNFGNLADLKLSDQVLMKEIGLLARERIVRRTLSGQDENDQAFAPYSAGYAKQKAAALGGSGTVDLQVSGRMLQGIALDDLTESSVTLTFKD